MQHFYLSVGSDYEASLSITDVSEWGERGEGKKIEIKCSEKQSEDTNGKQTCCQLNRYI